MFTVPKLANAYGETVYYGLYEHPYNSTYRFTPVANGGTFHRQENSYISGYTRVIFSERLGYPPVEGEDWTFKIKDPTANNQTLAYVSFSYSGQCVYVEYDGWGPYTLTCLSDPSLDYVFYFIGTFGGGCVPTQPYSLGFNHSDATAPDIGFTPTDFEPWYAEFNPVKSITPYIPADKVKPAALPEIQAGKAVIRFTVHDNLGCGQPVINTPVQLTNEIKAGSGSHVHFKADDYGTGVYTKSLPTWTGINDTKTSITVNTDDFGVVNAEYEAGLYGVDEVITAKTTGKVPYSGGIIQDYNSTKDMRIGLPGLIPLDTSGATYKVLGDYGSTKSDCDKTHNDGYFQRQSHYVTPFTYNEIQTLNDTYVATTGESDLCLNDASLQYGGFFDNGGTGRAIKGDNSSIQANKCHISHRRGNDIDVNVSGCGIKMNETISINGVEGKVRKRDVLDGIAVDMKAFKVDEEPLHYRFFE